ncbi:MAG: hypothetical protein JNJ83_07010 [Verrucomicrobiaceae bacterium]|nr:hypothetical protein [Verrucomicrobiaceae bacterium]
MKKLILIQNDFSGAGKSTVVRLLRRYLTQHSVAHQFLVLDEEESSIEPDAAYINPGPTTLKQLVGALDESEITIVEAASGQGEMFMKLYERHQLSDVLHEMGVETTVIVPVSNDTESFDAVTHAAEVYADNVQYLIAHSTTSAYDEDDGSWDSSYAARVMDMFEAVELKIPAATVEMEGMFRAAHTDLACSLLDDDSETFGKDYTKWLRRAIGQVETARQYLFGDAFRSLLDTSKEPATRGRRNKKAMMEV